MKLGLTTDEDYDPYEWKEPPKLGQRVMGAVLYEILSVSMFGDEVFVQPLPVTCWNEDHKRWEPVYHLGTEPRWKKVEDLSPCTPKSGQYSERSSYARFDHKQG